MSKREREVLCLIAAGQTAKEISRLLGISHRTVESHTEHLRAKMGVPNRSALTAKAVVVGLVTTADIT